MYAESADEVFVRWKAGRVAIENWPEACMANWHVTSFEQEDVLQQYIGASYTYMEATLRFSRAPEIWMWTYFLPTVCMTLVSYLGFYLRMTRCGLHALCWARSSSAWPR